MNTPTKLALDTDYASAIRTACDLRGQSLAEVSVSMGRTPKFLHALCYSIGRGEFICKTSAKLVQEHLGRLLVYIPHTAYDKIGKRVNQTRRYKKKIKSNKPVQLELTHDPVVEAHKVLSVDVDDPLVIEIRHLRRAQDKTNSLLQELIVMFTSPANKEGT